MPYFSLQQLLMRLAAVVVISAVHGFALTLVARLLGDRGPEYDGRLTLNPFKHVDLIGALGLLLFSLGWIQPVRVEARALRWPQLGPILLVILGLAATLVFAQLLALSRPIVFTILPQTVAFGTLLFIDVLVLMTIWFVALNLLPLPVLTGSYLLLALRPDGSAGPGSTEWLRRLEPYTKLALAIFIVSGVGRTLLTPLHQLLSRLLSGT